MRQTKPLSELILRSIKTLNFKWIKVKRYQMDTSKSWEERYSNLEEHHMQETTFLIQVIQNMADPGNWCDGFSEGGFCGHLSILHNKGDNGGCAECKCKGFTTPK